MYPLRWELDQHSRYFNTIIIINVASTSSCQAIKLRLSALTSHNISLHPRRTLLWYMLREEIGFKIAYLYFKNIILNIFLLLQYTYISKIHHYVIIKDGHSCHRTRLYFMLIAKCQTLHSLHQFLHKTN